MFQMIDFGKIKKLLLLMFLMFSFTGTGPLVQKVYADDTPNYIFKVENPAIQHAYFNIFNAIKVLFASPEQKNGDDLTDNSTWKTYTGLLKLVFVLSGFFIFAGGVVKIFGGGEAAAKSAVADFIKYILIGFVLIFILYSWKASVAIDGYKADTFCTTETSEDAHYYDVVDDFPGALAFAYTFINKIGLETSKIVQTIYAPSSEFVTTKNYGYMGALKANMHLLGIDINDVPYYQDDNSSNTAKADLGNRYGALMAQCILIPFSACPNGMSYINQMKQTGNIYGFFTNLYTINPEICSNTKAKDYKLNYGGETITCGDFWKNIKTLTDKWKNVLACSLPDVTKGGIALFDSNLSTPQTSDLQSIALQAGLVSQMQKTYANLGLGVNGIGYAAGKSKTEFIQSNLASGAYMSEMLPVLQMVIRALLYAFFPFVFVVILLPGGWIVLKQYLESIVWIELWTPTAGILNMFMLDYAQGRLEQEYNTAGINSYNITYYLSNDSTIAGVAGYLYLSVPALTWLILKGSGYMLGNITGAVGANMAKNIQTQAINQDTAELKKYQEFAEKTPEYVSMAEMSHYEALQKGAIAGGHLAGTKSISLEEQSTGAFAGSYVSTAKDAGQAIQTFNSISKHSKRSVSDASYQTGRLEGAKIGANMAEKSDTISIGQSELLGIDSAVVEKNTAIGKETSGAYTVIKGGKSVRKGDKRGETGEFKKYEKGIAEQTDLSMNKTMGFGLEREKLEKEGIRDATHKAMQLEEGLSSYFQAKGRLRGLHNALAEGELKAKVSPKGTIDDIDVANAKMERALVQGNAVQSLSNIFGPASTGIAVDKGAHGSAIEYVKNQIATGAAKNIIEQGTGQELRKKFGDYFGKSFSKKELAKELGLTDMEKAENMKPVHNVTELDKKLKKVGDKLRKINIATSSDNDSSITTKSVGDGLKSKEIGANSQAAYIADTRNNKTIKHDLKYNIKHGHLNKIDTDMQALLLKSEGVGVDSKKEALESKKIYDKFKNEFKNNGIWEKLESKGIKPTTGTTANAQQSNTEQKPQQPTTGTTANAQQSNTEQKPQQPIQKGIDLTGKGDAGIFLDQGKANADTMIGKAMGVRNNLTKDADMYLKNAQAQEMATQQSMAEKITTQGGIDGYVGTQVAASMLAAAAQKGETGQIKQLAKAAGFSDKDAQKILDSFKKGADELRKAGDDFANKLKDALSSIRNLAINQADFQAQKKQAAVNAEYGDAVENNAFNSGNKTLTSLGEEAYGAQGHIQFAKDTAAYTKKGKEAQRRALNDMFYKKMQAHIKNDNMSEAEAYQATIGDMKDYINKVNKDGSIDFKTGAAFKTAEAKAGEFRSNLTLTDGTTVSLGMGIDGTSGKISSGLSYTDDQRFNFGRGDNLMYNPVDTAIINHGGVNDAMLFKDGVAISHGVGGFRRGKELLFGRKDSHFSKTGLFGKTTAKDGSIIRGPLNLGKIKESKLFRGAVVGGAMYSSIRKPLIGPAIEKAKSIIKDVSEFGGKTFFKDGAEFIAKRAPGIGSTMEFADAGMRFASGDYVGAFFSGLAGVADFFPGIGTGIGLALDGLNFAKDMLFHPGRNISHLTKHFR